MGLIFERPASDGPGCHAFIVGVRTFINKPPTALALLPLARKV